MNAEEEKKGTGPICRNGPEGAAHKLDLSPFSHRMFQLFSAEADGWLEADERRELLELLRRDPQARADYAEQAILHSLLFHKARCGKGLGVVGSPAIDVSVGAAVEPPHPPDLEPQIPAPPFPSLSTTHYPLPTTPFVGSWAFSYMVATVIMGVAILGFWAYKITHHQHIAEAPSQSAPSDARQEMVFVGRITGMVDVKWSDDPRYLPPLGFAYAPLGRKYILSSGLLEITYDSGAKVILEGPCTYEVESTAGGYLALGKLTARVEKDKETRRQGDKEKKADAASPHLPVSPSPGLPVSPLFSVRTPTAIITDLGTEFGVEVDEAGGSKAHVFQGKVEMLVLGGIAGSPSSGRKVILGVGESGQVEHGADGRGPTLLRGAADAAGFVRVGQLAKLAEQLHPTPLRRWQAWSKELRNRGDLLAHYDFQRDKSDRSVLRNRAATGRQFDGRIEGAAWVSGRFPGKHALRFGWPDTGVRVNVPVECRQLTLAAWVKLDYLPTTTRDYFSGLLMSDGGKPPPPGQMHWQIYRDGTMKFSVASAGPGDNIAGFSHSVFGEDRLDQWCFVAATCDLTAGKMGFYLDGASVGEQEFAASPSATIELGPATIGGWDDLGAYPDDDRPLRGRMQELMVFRAALSADEIHRLFELQQPVQTKTTNETTPADGGKEVAR